VEPLPSGARPQRKVLIVEDHGDTRDLLVEQFRDAGYQVETAADGNEAVAVALRMRPDAIILDLAMPLLNGVDALAIFRSYPTTMAIPIVVYTANASMLHKRPLAYDALIEKPGLPEDVEQAVSNLLGKAANSGAPFP
jgi:two-component system phosphate regulon response regulator PhoB